MYGNTGISLSSSFGVIKCSGESMCIYWVCWHRIVCFVRYPFVLESRRGGRPHVLEGGRIFDVCMSCWHAGVHFSVNPSDIGRLVCDTVSEIIFNTCIRVIVGAYTLRSDRGSWVRFYE